MPFFTLVKINTILYKYILIANKFKYYIIVLELHKFPTPSKLQIHNNRKNPRNTPKKEYRCEICNVLFARPSHQKEHGETYIKFFERR